MALVAACTGSSGDSTDWNALPKCAVASGDTLSSPDGALCHPKSATPAGACSGDAVCGFCGYDPCLGGGGAGFAYTRCTCAGGSWSCTVLSQDASACSPVCPTARDPVQGLPGVFLPGDLPSGACEGAVSCFIKTATPCADPTALPEETEWTCSCVEGAWSCTVQWSTHSICPPADAGTDASG